MKRWRRIMIPVLAVLLVAAVERIADGNLYLKTVQEGDDDIIKNYSIDIAALDSGGPIIPKEVR